MCKNISAKSLSEILTVVMVVCQTQQDLKALPEMYEFLCLLLNDTVIPHFTWFVIY